MGGGDWAACELCVLKSSSQLACLFVARLGWRLPSAPAEDFLPVAKCTHHFYTSTSSFHLYRFLLNATFLFKSIFCKRLAVRCKFPLDLLFAAAQDPAVLFGRGAPLTHPHAVIAGGAIGGLTHSPGHRGEIDR